MDCLIVNRDELAEKYLQGKLDSALQDEFETHLVECAKCLGKLDLLQIVRQDLAERAHEIRGWTPNKDFFFRWRTIAIAAAVMMVIVGSIAVRRRKPSNATAHVSMPNAQIVVSAETAPIETLPEIIGDSSGRDYISFLPVLPSRVKPGKKRAERASASSESLPKTPAPTTETSQINALPMDARPYIEFPPNVEPGKTAERASASSESANVKCGIPLFGLCSMPIETPKDGQKTPAQVGEERPKPDVPLSDTHEKLELTTAQGVELKNLGSVDALPPPFESPGGLHQTVTVVVEWRSHKKNKPFQQGMTSGLNGNYREAEDFLEQAAKVEPKAGDIRFYLGICQLLNGDPQTATDTLKQATVMNSGDRKQEAHYYLAKGYVQIMKLQEAEDEFRTAAEMKGPLGGASATLLGRLRTLRAQLGTK